MITREKVDAILGVVPKEAKACYTGQSILAYCPNPTFTYQELNAWQQETDVDIFAYNQQSHASIIQAFIDDGWTPPNHIEKFKANRIRFHEPNSKFSLQTVHLVKEDMPEVNISWRKGSNDFINVIKIFDMDYLCVSMDITTRVFADLRGENHRVAHVNQYNSRFNPEESEPVYWYRQFERCPKGWSRGIDTRPVAQQYLKWIERTLELGDTALNSQTRKYKESFKQDTVGKFVDLGLPEDQASLIYDLVHGESLDWEATRIKHQAMYDKIKSWLDSVSDC